MALQKLSLRPGIVKDATPTSGKGGWYDADKVRFRNGFPEKIGGWTPVTTTRFIGTARSLLGWTALDGRALLGIGTNLKYYIEMGGTITDITPVRRSSSLTNALSSVKDNSIITVVDPGHGAHEGDYLEIVGSGNVGGIPAEAINKEHRVLEGDPNTYKIDVGVPATSTETNAGGT